MRGRTGISVLYRHDCKLRQDQNINIFVLKFRNNIHAWVMEKRTQKNAQTHVHQSSVSVHCPEQFPPESCMNITEWKPQIRAKFRYGMRKRAG